MHLDAVESYSVSCDSFRAAVKILGRYSVFLVRAAGSRCASRNGESTQILNSRVRPDTLHIRVIYLILAATFK